MTKLLAFTSVLTILSSYSANALPLPKPGQVPNDGQFSTTIDLANSYSFDGIVALNNCSGSVVRLEKSQDTDPALVFTNGHCYEKGFIATGKHVYRQPSSRKMTFLKPGSENAGAVNAVEVVYATMTNTDVAIYKLPVSYADLKAQYNVNPLTLSSARPSATTPIEIVSGYWRRGYKCSVDTFITQLKEDQWLWKDSIRYSRPGCETIGGTSGSPIINAGTRTMVGINNTGNESGEQCTFNNPCEIDDQGKVTYEQGRSYGQQTYIVYTCLNEKNEIDVSVPGCLLPH